MLKAAALVFFLGLPILFIADLIGLRDLARTAWKKHPALCFFGWLLSLPAIYALSAIILQ